MVAVGACEVVQKKVEKWWRISSNGCFCQEGPAKKQDLVFSLSIIPFAEQVLWLEEAVLLIRWSLLSNLTDRVEQLYMPLLANPSIILLARSG